MANIKFSQFTVGNTESDIDFVVGYKGANNIQISPANLLSATLSGYLPLTGGTMSGNIVFTDNVQAQFGTGNDLRLVHNGSDSYIQQTGVGDLILQQTVTNADISFQADNGSGGITEYFKLQGSNERLVVAAPNGMKFNDSIQAKFGNGSDLQIYHDGTNSVINNVTGNLQIYNNANDGDIQFISDDGSGGTTEYFRVDGGQEKTLFSKNTEHQNGIRAQFGNAGNFSILHDGSNAFLINDTGNLTIQQNVDDLDIIFKCDNGAGSVTPYITLDGDNVRTQIDREMRFMDTIPAKFGTGGDLQIYHDATDSIMKNTVGNLYISNSADDKDIIFQGDDGSGGLDTYFSIVGAGNRVQYNKNLRFIDNVVLSFGSDDDLQIQHNSGASLNQIDNINGDFYIQQNADDKDIIFRNDNGSGGLMTYLTIDGGAGLVNLPDNIPLSFGTGNDLRLQHNGTDNFIDSYIGHLNIRNHNVDKDIIFQADDGSGGLTEYFRVDGGDEIVLFSKPIVTNQYIRLNDNLQLRLGTGSDLRLSHDGFDSYIQNVNGSDLYIQNTVDDKDIIFRCDDGSGGITTYFKLDGSFASAGTVYTSFPDNSRATFGNNFELNIYHDGSNSLIVNSNGELLIRDNDTIRLQKNNGENMLRAITDGAVELYHNNVKKLETTSAGIKISGVSEYADNTAAIAGGLTTGDVYRTGDLLKIVH